MYTCGGVGIYLLKLKVMKAIPVLCLFILLVAGAYGQHPPAHATTPHDVAHQRAMQHHENLHDNVQEIHRSAHNVAVANHSGTIMDWVRKRRQSRIDDNSNSGLLTRWKVRRAERAAARANQ